MASSPKRLAAVRLRNELEFSTHNHLQWTTNTQTFSVQIAHDGFQRSVSHQLAVSSHSIAAISSTGKTVAELVAESLIATVYSETPVPTPYEICIRNFPSQSKPSPDDGYEPFPMVDPSPSR